ncbi:putative OPA3-like protein CG13603 isoform X2 [Toxorhynchites rutilus septentrionalis]|uniref:putative OPA3-like protein CG13603 isoform X2 n=1 Tax=Toxorhynchites rutilus septentrionalis TaxID=329112 RepID=UPI00247AFF9E|nr:putative OPA3-like protein CG13603 isoform X2 [Toxorhynchites rutilus septentrionalis]XP_055615569.1 putative OPA3-like protein CG13603 isoform X2 [Toxorhynchites rutilus septentrionalis]
MVVGAFPAAKLGVLAMKQISKPIANLLKERAKNSPFFRKYVCMPPAQFYNWVEVKTKMWAMNLGKPTNVPVLNEAMAIDLGANLLGEIIIFTIGAGLLLLEYQRQVRKESMKEEMAIQEKLELQATINELIFQAQRQDTQIREMARVVADLESKSSWAPKILTDLTSKKKSSEQPLYIPDTPKPVTDNASAAETANKTTVNLKMKGQASSREL